MCDDFYNPEFCDIADVRRLIESKFIVRRDRDTENSRDRIANDATEFLLNVLLNKLNDIRIVNEAPAPRVIESVVIDGVDYYPA